MKVRIREKISLLLRQLWASFVIKAEERGLGPKRNQELPEEANNKKYIFSYSFFHYHTPNTS